MVKRLKIQIARLKQLEQYKSEFLQNITHEIKTPITAINSAIELEVAKTDEEKPFEIFNLNSLIEKVIDEFSFSDIKINFIQNEEIMFNGNKDLFSIAVSNLLSNAIKYSETSKVDIILDRQNNEIELTVKDYGIGIKQECLNHIFERFYRVDKTRSRKLGGTGLGLSIVKNIIELHKGIIVVESEVGKGTSFVCKMPYLE